MHSKCPHLQYLPESHRRAGLVAVSEIAIMLFLMASLFWLGSQFVASVTNDPTSPTAKSAYISERGVYRISLDHDGERLWVYRPREGIVKLNLATGHVEQTLPLAGPELSAVANSRDGSTTLFCSTDGTVVVYRECEIVMLTRIGLDNELISEAAVSHDGTVVLCMTERGRVHGWRGQSELREFAYDFPEDSIPTKICLNESGCRLYAAGSDGTVSIHNPDTGVLEACVLHASNHASAATDYAVLAVSNDERLLALAKSTGELQVFDAAGGIVWHGRLDGPHPTAMSFSPDGRWIAAASHISKEIHLWDLQTGAAGRLCGHGGIVRCIQFAPTSDRLFSGSYDGTIREWSLATRSLLRVVD